MISAVHALSNSSSVILPLKVRWSLSTRSLVTGNSKSCEWTLVVRDKQSNTASVSVMESRNTMTSHYLLLFQVKMSQNCTLGKLNNISIRVQRCVFRYSRLAYHPQIQAETKLPSTGHSLPCDLRVPLFTSHREAIRYRAHHLANLYRLSSGVSVPFGRSASGIGTSDDRVLLVAMYRMCDAVHGNNF